MKIPEKCRDQTYMKCQVWDFQLDDNYWHSRLWHFKEYKTCRSTLHLTFLECQLYLAMSQYFFRIYKWMKLDLFTKNQHSLRINSILMIIHVYIKYKLTKSIAHRIEKCFKFFKKKLIFLWMNQLMRMNGFSVQHYVGKNALRGIWDKTTQKHDDICQSMFDSNPVQ